VTSVVLTAGLLGVPEGNVVMVSGDKGMISGLEAGLDKVPSSSAAVLVVSLADLYLLPGV